MAGFFLLELFHGNFVVVVLIFFSLSLSLPLPFKKIKDGDSSFAISGMHSSYHEAGLGKLASAKKRHLPMSHHMRDANSVGNFVSE